MFNTISHYIPQYFKSNLILTGILRPFFVISLKQITSLFQSIWERGKTILDPSNPSWLPMMFSASLFSSSWVISVFLFLSQIHWQYEVTLAHKLISNSESLMTFSKVGSIFKEFTLVLKKSPYSGPLYLLGFEFYDLLWKHLNKK